MNLKVKRPERKLKRAEFSDVGKDLTRTCPRGFSQYLFFKTSKHWILKALHYDVQVDLLLLLLLLLLGEERKTFELFDFGIWTLFNFHTPLNLLIVWKSGNTPIQSIYVYRKPVRSSNSASVTDWSTRVTFHQTRQSLIGYHLFRNCFQLSNTNNSNQFNWFNFKLIIFILLVPVMLRYLLYYKGGEEYSIYSLHSSTESY